MNLLRIFSLMMAIGFCILPAVASADTVSMSSVDQVLGALAEVVKDRAKEVATRAIIENLTSELCSGNSITVPLSRNPESTGDARLFYLGHKDGCKDENEKGEKSVCRSDVLFERTCRLIQDDPHIQLTDPHFLKTLSQDTVRFSVRLSTYKLNAEQFSKLNLEPFTLFVHAVMEQAVKGKGDLVSFSREVDKLVSSYAIGDSEYSELFRAIANTKATQDLLSKADEIVARDQNLQVPVGDTKKKKAIKDCSVDDFTDLFGKDMYLSGALVSSCTASFKEGSMEIEACRALQLKLRIIAPLRETAVNDEQARQKIRQIFYIIYESNIYKDAYVSKEFDAFAAAVKSLVTARVQNGWAARAAMSDTLRLIASIAQALDYEQKAATDWLKRFRQDVTEAAKKGTVESYGGLRSSVSFDWFNQNNYPPYTRRMRTNFKQMLVTPQLYLFRYEQGKKELERAFDVAQRLSNITILLTNKDDVKPSSNDMLLQARLVINQVAEIMKESKNPSELSDALDAFADILQHAEERDWVAIGLDISDRLRERAVSAKYQRSLRFSRTLLSMYQAESKEDAKAILQSTLENASSREQRYDQKTYDITALVGVRVGSVRQEWEQNASTDHADSTNFGYGIFAPFGLQIAKKCVGFMIYPVDLGAYLSGSNADQSSAVRVQSALHSGLALYKRFSAKTPTVLGISADYKPRFGTDDSQEIRGSIFFAIELPLYIIK